MSSSPLLLLVVPALAAALPLILWEPRTSWYQTAGRLGAFGLGLSAWIDLVDNCGSCAEDDPVLLTGGWALSGGLVAAGALAATVQILARRRQRA